MTANGIKTVIFSVSTPGIDVMTSEKTIEVARQCNEYGAKLRDQDPSRFGFFAMLPDPFNHPKEALDEIAYSLDQLHADGVCLFSRYGPGKAYLGHEEYRPLWDALDARKAVVFIHPSHPSDTEFVNPALPAPIIDYPHETCRTALDLIITNMVTEHPNCKIILSHSGGTLPYIALRAAAVLPLILRSMRRPPKSTEQMLDELSNFYFDVALGSSDLVLPLLTKFAKPGHVLFGSDLPYAPRETIDFFTNNLTEYEKSLSEEEAAAINRGNALKLFPRLEKA
ncbi:MAG: hypothetical protein Q9222_006892 [Ikaeria aurantiellina]